MANELSLTIERREGSGTSKARTLRAQGKVPGILYGHGSTQAIAIERRALDDLLHRGGRTHLIELQMAGKRFDTALVREVQIDPLTRKPIHVDLQRVSADEKVHAKLPLVMAGTPEGVRTMGGVMDVVTHELEVEGPASKLPDHLEVDVTALGIHDHITAGQVALPDGFRLITDAEAIVVTVASSKTAHALEEAAAGTTEQLQPEVIGKPAEGAET